MTTPPPTATVASATQSKKDIVRERALARWNALIKDDMDAAYEYMSVGSRSAISLDGFKRNTRRGAFRDAKVETIDCSGDACKVRLLVTYDHQLMKGITTPVIESWLLDNGQAWYVYRE